MYVYHKQHRSLHVSSVSQSPKRSRHLLSIPLYFPRRSLRTYTTLIKRERERKRKKEREREAEKQQQNLHAPRNVAVYSYVVEVPAADQTFEVSADC